MKFFNELIKKSKGEVYIIAEACDNHMGSYDMARALAGAAKKAGADAVKFQHHLVLEEMLPTNDMSDNFKEPLHLFLERNSLSIEDHINLKKYCNDIGITYLCTPFSYRAAEEIKDLVPFYKIGSGEFQDYWFIDKLINFCKPILFSTGMCTFEEIISWIERYSECEMEYALMNCLSEYPPKLEDMNLSVIRDLIDQSECVIGHSDHSQTVFTSIIAVALGAQIVEKHLTLNHMIEGPDASVSLDPDQFRTLVEELRSVRSTMGTNKKINDAELPVRNWAYRSVVSKKKIKKGQTISIDDLCTKRPTGGVPSSDYTSVIDKIASKDIPINTQIKYTDFTG